MEKMARPRLYIWPIPDAAAICQLQSTSGAGNLLLNGNITISLDFPGRAVFPGITRTVSLTSANDLSGENFIITGLLNGSIISETIAGPNANTIETTAIFDEVTAVHVSGAVSAVRIGTGTTGRTHWYTYNYNVTYNFVNVQISQLTGTINWTVNATFDDVATISTPFLTPIFGPSSDDEFGFGEFVSFKYAALFINSSGDDGSLQYNYMEQGTV
jgi:hypothetical protein